MKPIPPSRRHFLQSGAMAAAGLCSRPLWANSTAPLKLAGPRYFVTVFLRGGIDPVYTVDPKTKAQVALGVDVPYGPGQIVDAPGFSLGPHFAALKKWTPKMTVVKGVQVKTANHESGALQVLRMRTGVTPAMPSLFDIIGLEREQPLASVTLGQISSLEHSPGFFGGATTSSKRSSLHALDDLSDGEAKMLASIYRKHLSRVPRWKRRDLATQTGANMEQAADLFEAVSKADRFSPESWNDTSGGQAIAADFQRALWLIENDLTRGVYLKVFLDWDSHYFNATKQKISNEQFAGVFDKFLTELHHRSNAFGSLADQTCLVIGSELGRFPIINGNGGKDHFPEAPYIFMGPNMPGGRSFGHTGKMLEGQPISLKTGLPTAGGTHLVLDDIGTTLLHMAGINPRIYGYRGRRLSFLEAS